MYLIVCLNYVSKILNVVYVDVNNVKKKGEDKISYVEWSCFFFICYKYDEILGFFEKIDVVW